MKSTNRPSAIQRTQPTPTEKLHDKQGSSKGRKNLKPSNRKTSSSFSVLLVSEICFFLS